MMVHSIEFYEEEKQMEAGKSGVAGGKEQPIGEEGEFLQLGDSLLSIHQYD